MPSSRLFIDLDAIAANYHYLDNQTGPKTRTAAAVKANGYGLGMTAVSAQLYQSGCRFFFTAQLEEAIQLRQHFNQLSWTQSQIAVLEGPRKKQLADYQHYQLVPVINSIEQTRYLADYNRRQDQPISAILHLDTAMNRLGFGKDEQAQILADPMMFEDVPVMMVMSHLACADDPNHQANSMQRHSFGQLAGNLGNLPKSLCNSAGIFLGPEYHFDQTRPGIGLYGAMADPCQHNDQLRPVFTWQADILQIRTLKKGEAAGYGSDFVAKKPSRLATLGVGYADGYARCLYQPDKNKTAFVDIAGSAAPLAGRVSMDTLIVDVSEIEMSKLEKTEHAQLIGKSYSLEQMAQDRQTICYEVITGLGDRITRLYDGREQS